MRQSILDILEEIKVTTVYVTHDQEEAFEISDDICVMKDGIKMQQGTPEQLYDSPTSPFVANFIGEANVYNAEVESKTKSTANISVAGEKKKLQMVCRHSGDTDLDNPVVVIRPERIAIDIAKKTAKGAVQKYNKTSEVNQYQGEITHKIFRGASVYYTILVGDTSMSARSVQSKMDIGSVVDINIARKDALVIQGATN
jgi:ABC-type Fe3+/spermidine/putrescine transport system ATPase subunit